MAKNDEAVVTEATVTPTVTPTVAELQATFNAIRASDADITDVLKAARALDAAMKAEERAAIEATKRAARAEFEAKMEAVRVPTMALTEAVNMGIGETREAFVAAGVNDVTITIKGMHQPDMLVSVRPGGVPTERVSKGTGGPRAPRATLPDGRSWRQVADEAGLTVGVSSAHLVVFKKARDIHDSIAHDCTLS